MRIPEAAACGQVLEEGAHAGRALSRGMQADGVIGFRAAVFGRALEVLAMNGKSLRSVGFHGAILEQIGTEEQRSHARASFQVTSVTRSRCRARP